MDGLYRITDQGACKKLHCFVEGLEIEDGALFLGTPAGVTTRVRAYRGGVFHTDYVELVGQFIEE